MRKAGSDAAFLPVAECVRSLLGRVRMRTAYVALRGLIAVLCLGTLASAQISDVTAPVHLQTQAFTDFTIGSAGPTTIPLTPPLVFEPNHGQAPGDTAFVARGADYAIQIQHRTVRLAAFGSAPAYLEMELVGARPSDPTGAELQIGRSNYLLGASVERHLKDVPHFAKVEVRQAYPGIDVVYRGNSSRLEYDFVLAPGAQPGDIRLRFRGQSDIEISPDGSLVLRLGEAEWRQPKPVLYLLADHTPIDGAFLLNEDGTVGFSVSAWDRRHTLVIDPTLLFATYLGGSGNDQAEAVATDASGNIYVSGTTRSVNFPLVGAYQGTLKNSGDAFVTKLSPDGETVIYSTYIGGANTPVDEHAYGIAVDSSGRAWITGETWSSDFPTIASPLNGSCSASAFLSRLSAAGNALDFSICIPGGRIGRGVRLDGSSNVYVAGEATSGLPVVNGAQAAAGGITDGFVGKLNAAGTAWQYLTYLGGSSIDDLKGLAVDSSGVACVTGSTWSTNLPMVNALQPANASGGPTDAFLFKYNSSGGIVYSTYLGAAGADDGRAVTIDGLGNCYVTGSTSSLTFPLYNAAQNTNGGGADAFVTGFNTSGTALLFSTYLGGAAEDVGQAIAFGGASLLHLTGDTLSLNFPVLNAVQPQNSDLGTLWKSTDAGTSFLPSALSNVSVTAIAVDHTNAQRLYAGTSDGVYRSVDGGATWLRSDSGWTYTRILSLAIDPVSPCTIYAGVNTQSSTINTTAILRRSLDCGVSWGFVTFADQGRQVFTISPSAANPPVVYYTLERNLTTITTQRGVARSTPTGVEFSYPGPGGYYRVATDPANACTAYATETIGSVYKNTSCAVWNWSTIGSGLGWLTALAVHPSNQATVLVGNDLGVLYRKPDAANPFQLVATLNGEVSSIVYHRGNAQIVYASTRVGGIYKSTDGGASWAHVHSLGEISSLATTPAATNNLYAGTPQNTDIFFTRLSSAGAVLDSTLLGGRGAESARGIAHQPPFNWAVVAGFTGALDFPATDDVAQPSPGGSRDAFVARIMPNGECPDTISLQPASAAAAAGGGAASVGVAGDPFCSWTATSNVPWITITGGAGGFHTGTVNYSVAANPGASQRLGSITISGKAFNVTQAGLGSGAAIGVYTTGRWRLDVNGNGAFNQGVDRDFMLGWQGVTPVPGDWNGDGRKKAGIYINGFWYLDYDGNGVWDGGVNDKQYQFGWNGVAPLVGDWDGDGRDSIGIFINGFWFLDADGDGLWDGPGADIQAQFGWNGVTTFVGDWNGDGRDKIGIFINGFWYLDYNGNAVWNGPGVDRQAQFGWNGVTPLVGDWNGDGSDTIGIYINGFWYLDSDGDGLWDGPGADIQAQFGWTGVTPLKGDWNGDGRDKIGIFINGFWYLDANGNAVWDGGPNDKAYAFGQAGDIPLIGPW